MKRHKINIKLQGALPSVSLLFAWPLFRAPWKGRALRSSLIRTCYGALRYFIKNKKKKRQEAQEAFFSWDMGWFYEEIGTESVNTDHLC